MLAGLGGDRGAITIGARGRGGAQVSVAGSAADGVIDLTFAASASTHAIASARRMAKGGAGDDVITGQGGPPAALCEGMRGDFSTTCARRRFVVADRNPADGDEATDLLSGVSQLQFADAMVRLDDTLWM